VISALPAVAALLSLLLFLSVFVVAHLVAGVEMRATDKAFMILGTPLAMKIQGLRPIFIGVEIR